MQKDSLDRLASTSPWLEFTVKSPARHIALAGWPRWDSVTYQSGLPLFFAGASPVLPDGAGLDGRAHGIKRAMDVVLASLLLVVFAPLFALIALLIVTTSRGPVFFVQEREGFGTGVFRAYKFRTMRFDQCDASGIAQTAAGDPRITGIGRFLRRTSIDELPQLVNVVRGEMSLVGPRPHVADMRAGGMRYDQLVPYYHLRRRVRPGLTGWAQANGLRGQTHDCERARARIDHDIAYIQNFSPLLDLRIIVMTLMREFLTGSGD